MRRGLRFVLLAANRDCSGHCSYPACSRVGSLRRFRARQAGLDCKGDESSSLAFLLTFERKYDAGFLASYSDSRNWAKLALECSPQGEHMIVSVVTVDGFSDDSCHVVLDPQSTVYLRIAVEEKHTAFHYSTNGQYWHLVSGEGFSSLFFYFEPQVRVFRSVRSKDAVRFGLGVQSPTGKGTKSAFEQLKFGAGQEVKDIRNGQ